MQNSVATSMKTATVFYYNHMTLFCHNCICITALKLRKIRSSYNAATAFACKSVMFDNLLPYGS